MSIIDTLVADNGTKYKLVFSPSKLYHFLTSGNTNKSLSGSYTNTREAMGAWARYNHSLTPTSSVSGTEELETLEKKVDLLKWAEENNIEVPKKYKAPLSIKKFLMGGYDD